MMPAPTSALSGPADVLGDFPVVVRIVRNIADLTALGTFHADRRWTSRCRAYVAVATAADLAFLAARRRGWARSTAAVAGYVAAATAGTLGLARALPPRTLWRTGDDLIFSGGAATTVLLVEPAGLRTSIALNLLSAPLMIGSAYLNGEPRPLSADIRKRVALETLWSVAVTAMAAILGRAARHATATASADRERTTTTAAGDAARAATAGRQRELAERARPLVAEAVAEVDRRIAELLGPEEGAALAALLPSPVTDTGIAAGIAAVSVADTLTGWAAAFRARNVALTSSVRADPPLTDAEERLVALVVDVGLTNVAHHAPRSPARVEIRADRGSFAVGIRDWGPGPSNRSADRTDAHAHGLAVLDEHVSGSGGALVLEPMAEGMGTMLRVEVPR